MNKVCLALLVLCSAVAFALADQGKSNVNPAFPPPPNPPNYGKDSGYGKDNYGKAGYLPPLDPNRQQLPLAPIDPGFGLMNIFGLIMPIIVLVGLGILLMPLIMGFFGGPQGAHPFGAGYGGAGGIGGIGGPFFKRRSEGGLGFNLNKETIMDLISTVSEAIDKMEKSFNSKKKAN